MSDIAHMERASAGSSETAVRSAGGEWKVSAAVVVGLAVVSFVLMVWLTSPELSWDEAHYSKSTYLDWSYLWRESRFTRHAHGPMSIYLAKLGLALVPQGVASLEFRTRWLIALVSSVGLALLYPALRHVFKTSRAAALVGAGLLVLSFIRIEETNIFGPHHLMLAGTIGLLTLGYHFRQKPTLIAGVTLGLVIALCATTMTYVAPAVACLLIVLTLAGRGWVTVGWRKFHFALALPVMLLVALLGYMACWPAGILNGAFWTDLDFYLHATHPTLVGDKVYEVTPHWAAGFWMARLELPLLVVSVVVIGLAMFNSARRRTLSSKHLYVGICVVFFLTIMLKAHLAGARNLMQLVGVLSLAVGALFDDAFPDRRGVVRALAGATLVAAVVNLAWVSQSRSYTPFLATNGYRALIDENPEILKEHVQVLSYGMPVFKVYCRDKDFKFGWKIQNMVWSTSPAVPIPADVKYILMPAFVYECMPEDQPMRGTVARTWKRVWTFEQSRVWGLSLFERP